MTLSDDTLRAFLADSLSEEETQAIVNEMEADPDLERRIMALDELAAPVGSVMRGLPEDSRMERLEKIIAADHPVNDNTKPYWAVGVSIAAALVIGLLVGLSLPGGFLSLPTDQANVQTAQSNWRHEVARYQALYGKETVAHLSFTADELAAQFDRASDIMKLDFPVVALSKLPGIELLRVQVLEFDKKPIAQIVFRTSEGTPIALCAFAGGQDDKLDTAISATEQGLASVSWSGSTHEFMFIGGQDQKKLNKLAEELASLLS